MDREQLLKAAQKNVQNSDSMGEYEKDVTRKGILYATIFFSICCVAMVVVEMITSKKFDFGKPFLLTGFLCVMDWYEYRKQKKGLVQAIVLTVFSVVLLIFYIRGLFV